MLFSRIVTAALFGGSIAGFIGGLLQLIFLQPVLLHAELYEGGDLVHFGAEAVSAFQDTGGFDPVRDSLSVGFSMLFYIGYGLILAAVMGLAIQRNHTPDLPRAVIWGLAGYAVFHLAPAFSLPPEVPGVAAADVTARQIWWFGTAAATGIGLWLLAFERRLVLMLVAVVLIIAPHVIGAPHPDTFAGTVPPEIAGMFAARALGLGLFVWVLLGVLIMRFMQTEGVSEMLTSEQPQK